MRYRDFELSIRRLDRDFLVEARSPQGDVSERVEAAPAELAAVDAGAGGRDGASRDAVLRRVASGADDRGKALFARFFTGKVKALFDQSRGALARGEGLRVAIRAGSKDIEAAPWEALAGERPLGSDVRTAIVRRPVLSVAVESERAAREARTRVLVVLSSPEGLDPLDLAAERSRVEEALRVPRLLLAVTARFLVNPTSEELRAALDQPWDVLHFAGHGGHDREGAFIALRGAAGYDKLHSGELVQLVAGQTGMQLAFLNCCHGADLGPSPAPSLARELLEAKILAVVGMQSAISDEAATLFAKAVYGALAGGGSLEEAIARARLALLLQAERREGTAREDWIPALFVRQDVILRRPWLPVAVGGALLAAAVTAGVAIAIPPRFEVRVIDREGAPLSGAKVTIEGEQGVSVTTDEQGVARFRTRARRAKVTIEHQEHTDFQGELATGGQARMCWHTSSAGGLASAPCYLSPDAKVTVRVSQADPGLSWALAIDPKTREEWKTDSDRLAIEGLARTFDPLFGAASKPRRWVVQAERTDGEESLAMSFSIEQDRPGLGPARCSRKVQLRQLVPVELRSTRECEEACRGQACNRPP